MRNLAKLSIHQIFKTGPLKSFMGFIVILIWIIISGYISIGGLTMIEATEEVKLIEIKYDVEIAGIILFSSIDARIKAREIVNNWDPQVGSLSFEEIESINNLGHVYWYYRYPDYSYIFFLTILPYTALLFLTVGAAGVFGSVARLIIDHARASIPIQESKFITYPIFGFFMGIMVLAISYVIPSIFIKGETTINTYSVVLICFFSGIFSERFFNFIIINIEKYLASANQSAD